MQDLHLLAFLTMTICILQLVTGNVIFEAAQIEWEWPNDTIKDQYVRDGEYDPKVCRISGVQMGVNGEIFMISPRAMSRKGVPSSLNTLELEGGDSKRGYLKAYPDLASNKVGDCNAIQFSFATALDPLTGYLYVFDIGRIGVFSTLETPANLCPAKLVVLDTNAGGKVVRSHEFPDSVVPRDNNVLDDIVIDYVDANNPEVKYAYITDTLADSIVVFDFSTNSSWNFKHYSMKAEPAASNITVAGEQLYVPLGVNGIALSPTFDYLYYSGVGSRKLWQVPTSVLRHKDGDFSANTRLVGIKLGNSDGMTSGHKGLYYGSLQDDAVIRWEALRDAQAQGVDEGAVDLEVETVVAQDPVTMQWVEVFAWGNAAGDIKSLYFTSIRYQLDPINAYDFSGASGPNFRLHQIQVDDYGYLTKDNSQGSVVG